MSVEAYEAETGIRITRNQRRVARHVRVWLGVHQRPGWSGPLPFYLFHCEKHGLQVDYPHGFHSRLDCPECTQEEATKRTNQK